MLATTHPTSTPKTDAAEGKAEAKIESEVIMTSCDSICVIGTRVLADSRLKVSRT